MAVGPLSPGDGSEETPRYTSMQEAVANLTESLHLPEKPIHLKNIADLSHVTRDKNGPVTRTSEVRYQGPGGTLYEVETTRYDELGKILHSRHLCITNAAAPYVRYTHAKLPFVTAAGETRRFRYISPNISDQITSPGIIYWLPGSIGKRLVVVNGNDFTSQNFGSEAHLISFRMTLAMQHHKHFPPERFPLTLYDRQGMPYFVIDTLEMLEHLREGFAILFDEENIRVDPGIMNQFCPEGW